MAEVWKRVKLKDPITGEYLAPVTGQESDTIDADMPIHCRVRLQVRS